MSLRSRFLPGTHSINWDTKVLPAKAKQYHGITYFLAVLTIFWQFVNTTFDNAVLAVSLLHFSSSQPKFSHGERKCVCIFLKKSPWKLFEKTLFSRQINRSGDISVTEELDSFHQLRWEGMLIYFNLGKLLFLFGKATVHFGVKIILKIFTWLAKKRVGVIWKQILFWVVKTIYFGVRIILNVRKAAPIIRIRMVHSWKYLTFLISSITHAIVQIPLQEISLKWMFTFYFNDKLTFISKMWF